VSGASRRRRPARSDAAAAKRHPDSVSAPELQLRFFTISIHGGEDAEIALNRFLAGHRILAIDRQFVSNGPNSAWSICVSYGDGQIGGTMRTPIGKRGRVDFKDVLGEPEFAVFARLRALRKERADAEGVPAYALFTNEQLAEMVQRRVTSLAALREIAGVGEARVEKYGSAFLQILQAAALPETIPDEHET
jgi:superfamily II DNA helicase RecQ